MQALTTFGKALQHGWHDLALGWRDLTRRAGTALTRFRPRKSDGTHKQRDVHGLVFPSWGLLAGEVIEHGNTVVVQLELPGIRKQDCEITFQDGFLRVSGERQSEQEYLGASYYLMERAYGSFERTVELPHSVDPDSGTASLRDGVLRVEFTKKKGAATRRHQIAVK
jgi:HSP20 family protein